MSPRLTPCRAPIVSVDPPDASLASNAVVADAAHSVVKVRSVAPRARRSWRAAALSIAPNRVMTNAHVVAGGRQLHRLGRRRGTRRHRGGLRPQRRHLHPGCARTAGAAIGVRRGHRADGQPTPWYWDIPAAGRSSPTRRGSAKSSNSTVPTSTAPTIGDTRGVHDQRQSATRRFRRTAHRSARSGARHECSARRSTIPTPASCSPPNRSTPHAVEFGRSAAGRHRRLRQLTALSARASAGPTPTPESPRPLRTRRTACRSSCRSRRARSWSPRGCRSTRPPESGARARPGRCS